VSALSVRIRIEGKDRTLTARGGEDLLDVLQSNGEPIATSCGGVAMCGLCRLTVLSGGDAIAPMRPQERVHLGEAADVVGVRLACQAKVLAGVDADIRLRVPLVDDVDAR
jgi:ferredoxin